MALELDDEGNWVDTEKKPVPTGVNAPPGQGLAQVLARGKAAMATIPKSTAEEIEPSALKRGLAALGGELQEPVLGAIEKAQIAFPGKNTLQDIGADRAARREHLRTLEESPAGNLGGFLGRALPVAGATTPAGAALGAGIPAFLRGGPDQPTGILKELGSSVAEAVPEAALTWGGMQGIKALGKATNAARGAYTPEGAKAMELDAAARRLGLPPTTIGQLDPSAPELLRAHPDLTRQQADALRGRLSNTRDVPSPEGGMEQQVVPGGQLAEGVKNAIQVRQNQAREMYRAVDDFAAQNNLNPVDPNYTVNSLKSLSKLTPNGRPAAENPAFALLDHYDPEAFLWLKQAGSPQAARQSGMTMEQYHSSRATVNKALNALDRIPPATRTADQSAAYRGLLDVKKALDNDVERWAKQNSGNEEALGLYNRAKQFYSDVASPAVNSPLARKFTSITRGFQSPEQMYNAVLNPANRTLVERLSATADPETQDALRVLQDLPEVGRIVANPTAKGERGGVSITQAAHAATHPLMALGEYAPGLKWLASQRPAKAVYFARPPSWVGQGPLSLYGAEEVEGRGRSKLSPQTE